MDRSERSKNTVRAPFSLTVDRYGRVWLHAHLEGQQITIDLADKNEAFQIMAATMADHGYEYRPSKAEHDGAADNDDEIGR